MQKLINAFKTTNNSFISTTIESIYIYEKYFTNMIQYNDQMWRGRGRTNEVTYALP